MAEVTLIAEPGRATGTPESKRLRASGRIPAVVYGHGGDATAVSVDARELRLALSGDAGTNQLLDLQVGSERHLTMARVIQRHPVRNTVVHIDFQVVRRDEVLSVDVPLILEGEPKAVDREQGLVEQLLTSLTVQSTPGNIPNELIIDISGLQIGDTIRVADIALPANVTTDIDPEEAVVVAAASRVAAEVEEIEEEAAEAAAEASEAAEGEAPEAAAGGDDSAGGEG
ncbi:50S ribosomal protein L25 [Acidiferrimicrobium sp. IK]|uniref:50S ribosomal protein L25 n=1 Tax=Acidiferrimicrobium sp. IK TaxID=2871700 RepID=UPI0021CAE666|nr:50S ribosomal protein L25 [Acidiferrimicrobium sp. IK]MCU4187083.1 50S ribosomal protein L25 [Acidiferrimicrobium sp. IK]